MSTANRHLDPEDMFADTRMSFGDHLDELRSCLWRAIIGFGICLVIGFFLDGIGQVTGLPIGLGKPVLAFISKPVEDQLERFYENRFKEIYKHKEDDPVVQGLNQPTKFFPIDFDRNQLQAALKGESQAQLDELPEPNGPGDIVSLRVRYPQPLEEVAAVKKVQDYVGRRKALTTLSVQEAFMVYFKVSILCGIILSSPWVFWQIWSFVAAGLYPQEKRYVHVYLPFSLGLFLGGIFMCQLIVMPRAVEALLWFNEWIGMEPDLRLNEWLGFAIIVPLIFGIAFQTPLVMLFLNKIGVLDVETFRQKRRLIYFLMAIFCAIGPSVDPFTMMFMWLPMCGLFELGIILIKMSPPKPWDIDVPDSEETIEV